MKSIREFLIENYSLKKRLGLLNHIAVNKREKQFIKKYNSSNVILDSELIEYYSLVYNLLKKEERPKSFKRFTSYPGFKSILEDEIIESYLKRIKK